MNAFISTQGSSLSTLCRDLGISRGLLESSRLDVVNDPGGAMSSIGRSLERLDDKFAAGQGKSRMDASKRKDAASAFLTSPLSQVLAPITRVSNERFLFAPGRTSGAGLLPVQQRVELGMQQSEWMVIGMTGEARHIGHGGLADLTRVGAAEDLKTQPVSLYGVRFGWDQFELWQAAHLGRNVQTERQTAARQAMSELFERDASFGDLEREIPGFFGTGAALTVDLERSFGDPALTFDQAMTQLAIMDCVWERANPSRNVSGVVMPKTHFLNLIRIFRGTDDSTNLWEWAIKSFSWLANIVQDDRLLTASPTNGPIWQMWSADSEELYIEASPTPMLFGPFDTELSTDFIMIASQGGVINKRYERICRFQQPAPA